MSLETTKQLLVINTQILVLSAEARNKGFVPVNPLKLPAGKESDFRPDLTPSGFWCHYISGEMSAYSSAPPEWIPEIVPAIDTSQRRLLKLAEVWSAHPVSQRDYLNQATTQAFIGASKAARWSENMDYTRKLTQLVAKAGRLYARREGIRLIGDTD